MISGLLWRCPICKENDAIIHNHRFLRPDKVECTHCNSLWELRRVRGGTDYQFKAISGPMAGIKHPLATWYDMMRDGFDLTPIPSGDLKLEDGEQLFLTGKAQNISVVRKDPRFAEAIQSLPPQADSELNTGTVPTMAHLGSVDLALTNERFIVVHNERVFGLMLSSIRGIEILLDRLMIIRHEKRLIEILTFEGESPLKWRAYFEKVLEPIAEDLGIKIRMPYD